jgi:hypothetical protein
MDDFTELAVTLAASVGDARGSLILSRDGLVLGAGPEEAEGLVKPAWVRFATLGEPERGFVQFGTELWCYVRRGPYAAFVLAGTRVRPGLVIDQMDRVLLAAEEARAAREGLGAPEPPPAPAVPTSKPRSPLHPETKPSESPAVVAYADAPATRSEAPAETRVGAPAEEPVQARALEAPAAQTSKAAEAVGSVETVVEAPHVDDEAAEVSEQPAPTPLGRSPATWNAGQMAAPRSSEHTRDRSREGGDVWAADREEGDEEVDRFSLAREFSQLLQEGPDAADG